MMSEFGATVWGRAWTRTVEKTSASVPNPSLPKARTVARNQGATVTTEVGTVTATVAVSGAAANVRIEFPSWPEPVQRTARELLAASLAAHPGLAAGDLPDGLADDFASAGITFAVPLDEHTATCDCRSRKRPCVHILATLYALSMRIDERPRLALELRMAGSDAVDDADREWIPLDDLDVATFYG
ncbi:SWIM zinc finger family protein [Tsukamurella sp. 8F]|uniref:SWIM zinc finger family protein n=1 Tax=unclassified Tsukamurella TaxID=2633480 RepID=UPI0023B8E53B|nr:MULTISPECIES: SWIM zinc finger family protein [unclassified Tsukamurella]MDF0529331.1 SWIM zinc finger family protein [Tsukamurella sp. 8J]MDF0587162.1 SWIM zinc finger family protein [Tsukamurella sp. 8F]